MGFSVMLAVRNAIAAARFKGSEGPSWFRLGKVYSVVHTSQKSPSYLVLFVTDGPATNPSVQAATGVTSDDFYL